MKKNVDERNMNISLLLQNSGTCRSKLKNANVPLVKNRKNKTTTHHFFLFHFMEQARQAVPLLGLRHDIKPAVVHPIFHYFRRKTTINNGKHYIATRQKSQVHTASEQ